MIVSDCCCYCCCCLELVLLLLLLGVVVVVAAAAVSAAVDAAIAVRIVIHYFFRGGKWPTFSIFINLSFPMNSSQMQLPLLARYRSYPPAVWFIVGNEFCERFSYYGMKAVLALYLKNRLGFGEDSATVLYHCFTLLCYFTPFVGAALADQVRESFLVVGVALL